MLKGRFIELKSWKYCTIPKLWATGQKDKMLHNRIALLGESAGAHQSGGVFSQQHGSPLCRNNDRFCAHILPLLMANTCGFSSPKTPSAFCVLGSTVVVADFLMEVKRGVNV